MKKLVFILKDNWFSSTIHHLLVGVVHLYQVGPLQLAVLDARYHGKS